ncbi:hypothetical protein [Flavobacterium magnum]|uniref:hypothetical protein n=1 Tax=Flavobacterium magnum TaxID=2162713 RepID=UPI0015E6634F|nr:hypothetical protein [Flavobacterium magnum]
MKKVILMAAMISSFAIVSCKKDAPAPPPAPEAPAEAPAPPPPPPTPEAAPEKTEDGTSVTVGKNGVDVQTKTETKSTTVEVNKKGAAIEVKK